MKNNKKLVAIVVACCLAGAMLFIWIVIATLVKVGREVEATSNAQAYDLNCLTQPIEKPLTECKENR